MYYAFVLKIGNIIDWYKNSIAFLKKNDIVGVLNRIVK